MRLQSDTKKFHTNITPALVFKFSKSDKGNVYFSAITKVNYTVKYLVSHFAIVRLLAVIGITG